jgi:hypothetical protein
MPAAASITFISYPIFKTQAGTAPHPGQDCTRCEVVSHRRVRSENDKPRGVRGCRRPGCLRAKYEGKVIARISNFGSEDVDTAIEFKLNDLPAERKPLKLTAGGTQNVEFTGFNVPEGSNRGTVEIAGDTFALDNKLFFTIRRENQTRVLAIETAARGRSEFLPATVARRGQG